MSRPHSDEALLLLARTIVGVSTSAADRLGISVVQLRALTVLRGLGTAPLRSLAEGMGVTVSTTSRLVDRLVAAGLVERRASPTSRRELALEVAPAGQDVLDRYDELRLTDLRAVLDRLPEPGREQVVAAFAAFGEAAEQAVGRAREQDGLVPT